MKNLYCITVLYLFGLNNIATAQTSNWLWAKSSGGNVSVDNCSISCEAKGYIYVTGGFNSIIIFGDDTLTNTGIGDNYLVKYDSSGKVIWAKSTEGGGFVIIQSITTDAKGYVYLTGVFEDIIIFGSDTLTNGGADTNDIFLAKYDSSGKVIWAKSTEGTSTFQGFTSSISSDANGYVYLTGEFSSPIIIFGSDTLHNANAISGYGENIFVVKYDSSGKVIWAKNAKGGASDAFGSISSDTKYIYVTGGFWSPTIIFGSDTLTVTNIDSLNGSQENIFLVKYDSSGKVIWAKSVEGTGDIVACSISSDAKYVYVAGGFIDTSIIFGNDTLTKTGRENTFLAKYDSSGKVIWAKSAEGSLDNSCQSISTDANGYVYVTGGFYSPTIIFGNDTLSAVNENIFVVKYDSSGKVIWAKSTEGSGCLYGSGIGTDANGHVYVTGVFNFPYGNSIIFGNDTLSADAGEFFIAKIDNTFTNGIVNEKKSFDGITVYPNPSNGNFYIKGLKNENTIEVYDLLGEIISTTNTTEYNSFVNLTGKAKGIYFYRIINNTSFVQQGKIIIE